MNDHTSDHGPMRPQTSFPNGLDFLALLLLFGLSALLSGLLTRWLCPSEISLEEGATTFSGLALFLSYGLQMGLMLGLTLLYRRLRGGRGPMARFARAGWNPLLLLWGLLLMLSISVVVEPLLDWIDLFPTPDPGRGGWTLLSTVIMAPLLEEFLCRGVLLESLRIRYGIWMAWVGSALFFGVIHLHPAMMLNAFLLGLLFAWLVLRSGSLWPSILLHAINNALALLLMWAEFPGEHLQGLPMSELTLRMLVNSPLVYGVIYALSLLILIVSSVKIAREMRQLNSSEQKKQREEVIKSAEDALNSGKKS